MQELQSNGAPDGEGRVARDESGPQEESPKGRAFLASLVRELFQTERSAKAHPLVEAERLGDVPPAHAMRAVSAHAEAVLTELPSLFGERGLPISAGGSAVGHVFSALRDDLADYLLNAEKSYRGTLLGMRHGIDLVELIQYVAAAEGDTHLAAWCARWLAARKPLVEAAAGELAWFAARPARATRAAKDSAVAHLLQGLVHGAELAAHRLRRLAALAG
ncbi:MULTISPECIES: hypothetical protein [Sorangium]|uniref:Uncharacterized protein n=1 Tax=Sorangium cellulosum TaxID=56 RepID=A0A4P2R5X1_SORCE|nr:MULTISPECIES: hypothetical protein [Sorangium]AUX38544.1 uncharacterized protein SOCE836_107880 [Sorangium cellulosum]WCQ97830.1 hypothetical protein NQZ70_10628 [Sorangium sp. Soce836]